MIDQPNGNPLRRSRGKPAFKRSERGIALFMVIAAMAVLIPIVAEMNYSIDINSRMAYNSYDNLRAYYLAKAAYKLSLVRLKAYLQVKQYLDNPDNKQIKANIPPGTIDKIWSMPLLYPLPIPPDSDMATSDAIKEFEKKSAIDGSYTANISGESSKLNLNNLLLTSMPPDSGATGASGASGASGNPGASPQASAPPTGSSGASGMNFAPVVAQTIESLLEARKNEDHEFADVYRNVQGKDLADAIVYYMVPEKPLPNLPGFTAKFKPKLAPLYSMSELHFIPGIDDELYKLIEPSFTVYNTPGISANTINKRQLMAFFPTMTDPEADDVLRKRDDPDVGKPWASEDDFWAAIQTTSAGKNIDQAKATFNAWGLRIKFSEESFKISILANVGQSTRRLEANVIIDSNAGGATGPSGSSGAVNNNIAGQGNTTGQNGQQDPSAKKPSGISLIYWRML